MRVLIVKKMFIVTEEYFFSVRYLLYLSKIDLFGIVHTIVIYLLMETHRRLVNSILKKLSLQLEGRQVH
jgi:hypothetical protein